MPSSNPPRRRKRSPQHVAEPGKVGRMTGLTLAERSRDEHGLEDPTGLFSPTPGKPSTRKSMNSTGMSIPSESMEVAESSAPEPSGVLSTRRLARDGRAVLPLPVSRSPIKTNIGATPRRGSSIGALSPTKATGSLRNVRPSPATIKRKLDFSGVDPHDSPYGARKSPKISSSRYGRPSSRASAIDPFDLPQSSPIRDMNGNAVNGNSLGEDESDGELPNGVEENGDGVGPFIEDEPEYIEEGDAGDDLGDASIQLAVEEAQSLASDGKAKPGRARTSGGRRSNSSRISDSQRLERGEEGNELEETSQQPPKKRGRPPKARVSDIRAQADDGNVDVQETPVGDSQPVPRKRGRPPKSANAKLQGQKKSKPAVNELSAPHQPVATQRLRHQTPMEEDGVFTNRTGRHIYKPLEYWKGEKAIFQENSRYASLQEIIRVDDLTPVKRHRANSYQATRKKRKPGVFEEDIDDDGPEPWETGDGVVEAPVRAWDSEQMLAYPDEEEIQQIAFASSRMQPRAAPTNPNFMFTKTITMPFFGSGVIELPPGGVKGLKNSRKYQFMFFVYLGKVAVEIAGTRFSISKGGMWQVPRGNFYSIHNESDHPAKMFFAQSCEVAIEPREPPSLQNLEDEVDTREARRR